MRHTHQQRLVAEEVDAVQDPYGVISKVRVRGMDQAPTIVGTRTFLESGGGICTEIKDVKVIFVILVLLGWL